MTSKLFIELDLGYVEVQTDSNHGAIEHIWFGGIDAMNMSVAELVEALVPPAKWQAMLEKAMQDGDSK